VPVLVGIAALVQWKRRSTRPATATSPSRA
jgi:hypothetical protein